MVQRGHHYAIVDEVDSILVDEARTPLIISGPLDDKSELYSPSTRFMPGARAGDYEIDEKQRTVADRGRQRAIEELLREAGLLKEGDSLYDAQNVTSCTTSTRAAGAFAVPARQGLHRPQRRGRHHRRVHRPHDAGPPLFGRPAPGARGQGARQGPARERDAGLDHLPELFPPLQEARRHDRHGRDRGRRILGDLQVSKWSRSRPTCRSRASRRGRRGLPHLRGEGPRRSSARSRRQPAAASRCSSARPRSKVRARSPIC
jgi:hypothetical protein